MGLKKTMEVGVAAFFRWGGGLLIRGPLAARQRRCNGWRECAGGQTQCVFQRLVNELRNATHSLQETKQPEQRENGKGDDANNEDELY